MDHEQTSHKKLYSLTSPNFNLLSHVSHDGIPYPLDSGSVPTLWWPDGRWCYPANLYMAALVRKAFSRRNRGGTLHTYATQLSHLLRFCFYNNTDFIELTDNKFTLFARGLAGGNEGKRERNQNSARAICAVALDFLEFVGNLYGKSDFVSKGGTIRANRVSHQSRVKRSRNYFYFSWVHPAIPSPAPVQERLPVAKASISLLRKAAIESSTSMFIRKRRLMMLLLLEITGGRRGELAELTLDSVINASKMEKPMLELVTLKGRGAHKNRVRVVPIAKHDVHLLEDYLELYRNPLVRRRLGKSTGDGRFLVSETTGRGLQANTISQELWDLRHLAGISGPACAHMFRHRFCTKLFVDLMEQHRTANKDEFKKYFLSNEDLKQKVCEWTGHRNINSLDRYLHLAFEETRRRDFAIDAVVIAKKLESFISLLEDHKLESTNPLLVCLINSFLDELRPSQ